METDAEPTTLVGWAMRVLTTADPDLKASLTFRALDLWNRVCAACLLVCAGPLSLTAAHLLGRHRGGFHATMWARETPQRGRHAQQT